MCVCVCVCVCGLPCLSCVINLTNNMKLLKLYHDQWRMKETDFENGSYKEEFYVFTQFKKAAEKEAEFSGKKRCVG